MPDSSKGRLIFTVFPTKKTQTKQMSKYFLVLTVKQGGFVFCRVMINESSQIRTGLPAICASPLFLLALVSINWGCQSFVLLGDRHTK